MNRILSILATLSLLLVSCEQVETPTVPEGKVRVTIKSGSEPSRTSVADNGLSSTWCNNDQIAVWASNGSTNVLNAQPFWVYYSIGNYAEFTSDITPMGNGNFTYYATHPVPASISGTKATFPIERVQQGSFDGTNDILVAYPTTGLALDNESAEVGINFKHKMHTLRMFVPDDVEGMGEPIRRVDITFPTQVVGDVSVDYTSATTPATLSNGSNVVSVEIPEGLSPSSASDRQYAYAIVFPATMSGSDKIEFTVHSDNFLSRQSFSARTLSEGGSTPVRLTCTPMERLTLIHFTIKENFLGEDPIKVTFKTANNEFVANAATTFDKLGYFNLNVTGLDLAGQPMTVIYESENAIVSQEITLPNYASGDVTNVELTVPYLLFENFNNATESESYGNNDHARSDRNQPGVLLDGAMPTSGWNAARYWLKPGAMRINTRFQCAFSFESRHYGRLDTPTLGGAMGIKPGKTVNVIVTFDAASYISNGSVIATGGKGTGSNPKVVLTTHTITTNPIDGIPTGKTGLFDEYPTTLNDFGTICYTSSNLQSVGNNAFGSSYPTLTTDKFSVNENTRLCFYPTFNVQYSASTGNAEVNVYIDNIKVSIAK